MHKKTFSQRSVFVLRKHNTQREDQPKRSATFDRFRQQLLTPYSPVEIGLFDLDRTWNVTPQSNVSDEAVKLWHYNDGTGETRELKQSLLSPGNVARLLGTLAGQWPRVTERFRLLYDEVRSYATFRPFLWS